MSLSLSFVRSHFGSRLIRRRGCVSGAWGVVGVLGLAWLVGLAQGGYPEDKPFASGCPHSLFGSEVSSGWIVGPDSRAAAHPILTQ